VVEVTDTKGLTNGEFRVLRGGCWFVPDLDARSFGRYGHPPLHKTTGLGFRLARTALD
jgi:formylglycine-generating enzyme required for sulfatase activity